MTAKQRLQYDAETLRNMRTELQLSIKDFWGAMGYNLSRGCAYETGRTKIPEHVNRLVHLHYVAGIPTDIRSAEFKNFSQWLTKVNPLGISKASQLLSDAMKALSK